MKCLYRVINCQQVNVIKSLVIESMEVLVAAWNLSP